jgi:hypothetical protein
VEAAIMQTTTWSKDVLGLLIATQPRCFADAVLPRCFCWNLYPSGSAKLPESLQADVVAAAERAIDVQLPALFDAGPKAMQNDTQKWQIKFFFQCTAHS